MSDEMVQPAPGEQPAAPITSIWKPKGEEFYLDGDFSAIAGERTISEMAWTVIEEERDGVAGHTLAGSPRVLA
jgi:hypothetical protein